MKYGDARVSTDEQNPAMQLAANLVIGSSGKSGASGEVSGNSPNPLRAGIDGRVTAG